MKKAVITSLFGVICSAAAAISMTAITLGWFMEAGGRAEDFVDGEIGLHGYFFAGDGTAQNPYEIVTPTNLYNLSRLQNLGIFTEQTHFQVGHVFDETDGYQCMNTDGVYTDYLDMGPFCDITMFRPIGSESTPFIGIFDGKGIPIKNLVVTGHPEDIGMFGYVSYRGMISNLVCDNLEIISTGYSNSVSDETYMLFNPEIDDLFDEHAHYFATDTSLSFYQKVGSGYEGTLLKVVNGIGGVSYLGIDDSANRVSSTDIYNGYFLPTYPNVANDPFTYSWSSSSSLISGSKALNLDLNDDGNPDELIVFDLGLLANAGSGEGEFNSGDNMQVDAKLSLVASVTVDGHIYSRVIQSYTCEFFSNSSAYGDGDFSVSIFCDYVAAETPGTYSTNYHHGNNIGFLVGHLDGTLQDSYVYEGKLSFNQGSEHHISCETQTGLVGEVGTNVMNTINPDYSTSVNGEIGVMNFTGIYRGIRRNVVQGENIQAGHDSGLDFICYDNCINTNPANHASNPSHFDLYSNFLRHTDTATPHYITSVAKTISGGTWVDPHEVPEISEANNTIGYNSVDFLFNNVIEDEKNELGEYTANRGLGVFKMTTPYNGDAIGDAYGLHMYENFGDCRIINGESKTKVYFSTAEYNHTVSDQPAWGYDSGNIQPLRATTLPSYSDIASFEYPFSRDYNYVFELDLAQNTGINTKNYMYNTDSPFLTNYLSSKLKDKYGLAISPGNYRFGFMFRTSENEPINALSSYMPIGEPGAKHAYPGHPGVYYPSNSIVFKIENEAGANISVVGNKNDISVYSFNSSSSSGGVTKMYTMKCANTSTTDAHRYFTYDYSDVANGATSTETVKYSENDMGDGGALYAHIFYLPQGEYAIGSSSVTKANLYYLAVQGQTAATIDTNTMANIGGALRNADFLLEPPTKADFPNGLSLAHLDFASTFNTNNGVFNVTTKEVSFEKYLSLEFEDAPLFVTYLFAFAYDNEPKFYVNNIAYQNQVNVIRQ